MTPENVLPEFDASAFEVARLVTVPFLVMEPDVKYFVRFDSTFEQDTSSFSERMRKSRKQDETKDTQEVVRIAKITNLATKQPAKLIAHATLESNLKETYKNDEYVGKMFQIEKRAKAKGKSYFTFDILELKLKESATNNPEHKGAKK